MLSPLVRGLNWLGYQSGLIHLQTASSSFAGAETRDQLDFAARYYYRSSPAVVARGTLGMLHWDASDVLERISVPVLIVSGDQDTTTLPIASDHMGAKMPRDARVSVSPAAHLGPIEQHERYNAAIETFALRLLRDEREAAELSFRELPLYPWSATDSSFCKMTLYRRPYSRNSASLPPRASFATFRRSSAF